MNITEKEIKELKKTWKGKFKLWRKGVEKFKEDPSPYRISMMQGLSLNFTIYMIIFACVYAISAGLWIFALLIVSFGTIGNYYASQSHFIRYRGLVKQYELAGLVPSIEEDISNLRKKWRIIEKQVGFFLLNVIFFLFTVTLGIAYFGSYNLYWKLGIVIGSIPILFIVYFSIFYRICNHYYQKNKEKEKDAIQR